MRTSDELPSFIDRRGDLIRQLFCQLFPTRQTGVAERHAFNLFSLKHSLVQTTLVAVLTLDSGIGWAWGLSMGKMERYFFVAAATSFLTLIAAIALLELMPS